MKKKIDLINVLYSRISSYSIKIASQRALKNTKVNAINSAKDRKI